MSGADTQGGDTGARDGGSPAAPRLLSRLADPAPVPPPLHGSDEVAHLHLEWARLAGGQGANGEGARDAGAGGVGGGGVRAKVRARVVAAARADAVADRALIGDLIRAVDAVAARVDHITERVGNLELLVQEVLDRVSEDLVRVQVAIGSIDDGQHRGEPGAE